MKWNTSGTWNSSTFSFVDADNYLYNFSYVNNENVATSHIVYATETHFPVVVVLRVLIHAKLMMLLLLQEDA
ncbi:hypothetical protein Leryth_000019 [Lithospermum erythrorhizon]|nr:hypothetical protein Leryth_000019 [Lithospermum erythrorhizon]